MIKMPIIVQDRKTDELIIINIDKIHGVIKDFEDNTSIVTIDGIYDVKESAQTVFNMLNSNKP